MAKSRPEAEQHNPVSDIFTATSSASTASASTGADSGRESNRTSSAAGSSRPASTATTGTQKSLAEQYFTDTTTMRATYISAVLHNRSEIMASSMGSEATYALSHDVEGDINTFISHNWCVSRRDKFRVLSFYFNLRVLVVYSALVVVVALLMEELGLSPKFSVKEPHGLPPATVADMPMTCQILSLGSVLPLAAGHEIMQYFGMGREEVFLDKTCIDQRTEEAKIAGIGRLGSFVVRSERLFVIYTDCYLQRLWTVYELATFILLKPKNDIVIFPTLLAGNLYKSLIAYSVFRILWMCGNLTVWVDYLIVHGLTSLQSAGLFVITVMVVFRCFSYLREWAHEQSCMAQRIKDFSVMKANCFHEPDRYTVRDNILDFLRYTGGDLAPDGGSDNDLLASFDKYVRESLPEKLEKHGFMSSVAPYRCIVALVNGEAWAGVDKLWSTQPDAYYQFFVQITIAFCQWPLLIHLSHWFAHRCLSFRQNRRKERLYVAAISIIMPLSSLSLSTALKGIGRFCHHHYTKGGDNRIIGVYAFASVLLMHGMLVLFCFGAPRCCRRLSHRRVSPGRVPTKRAWVNVS